MLKRALLRADMIRLACAILTFVVGVTGTCAVNRVWIRFRDVDSAAIGVPPNGRGWLRVYVASDGIGVGFERVGFPSVEEARLYFEELVGKSNQIKTTEFLRDREGKSVVGKRVMGLFPTDDGLVVSGIVCQDGPVVYVMSSTSLRHLLIFENAHRRY